MNIQSPVKLGIVGLGRWAKVLTNAAQKSDKLQIIAGTHVLKKNEMLSHNNLELIHMEAFKKFWQSQDIEV